MSKRICAWCEAVLGEADTPEDSHGVCESCKEKYLQALEGYHAIRALIRKLKAGIDETGVADNSGEADTLSVL